MNRDSFVTRHIGPNNSEVKEMLEVIGETSVESLIDKTVPTNIRLEEALKISKAQSEFDYLNELKRKAAKNKSFKSYIGLGYYDTIVPAVILRNVLENPGWYTAYTPYQAEIAQGRLEALLNFQTMVMDLTNMEMANASLLDEGTAAAEAMIMFYNSRSRSAAKAGVKKFLVSDKCFPQTIEVMETRANPLGIELVVADHNSVELDETFFGAVVQYPDVNGHAEDLGEFVTKAKEVGIRVGVGADLLSLALLKAPGDWGVDVVFGTTQRFGVPMGLGGPHAAYFAAKTEYKRNIPGRIIGVSVDVDGNPALRMALQTREQHIKREKATSNICTAQALLAVMASMYAVFHGPQGITRIAENLHKKANFLAKQVKDAGYSLVSNSFFDTITFSAPVGVSVEQVRKAALNAEINLRYDNELIGASFGETVELKDILALVNMLREVAGKDSISIEESELVATDLSIPSEIRRDGNILTHEVFNSYRSETDMMRYLKKLENKDLSLTHSMIPLGSCTMKLNAASELIPITWPEFANVHPFVPQNQIEGYIEILNELERDLSEITGFHSVSLQPNSGAQGEYAGLMVIRAYHQSKGDHHRNVVLIPSSAHGTNPASAVMAGMKVIVTKCDEDGNIDVADIKAKAEENKENLAALMITYPSTHGVFEAAVTEITSIIHENGGRVYMDGANMNAQVGLTNPGRIGADVCHLNLHKTFAIPHGGGGPGMGPIGVVEDLAPFLPGNPISETGGENAIGAISAAPWGSALILLISYGYVKMLGSKGLTDSTKAAILNANYLRVRLKDSYDVLYKGENGTVAHEMIIECRNFKKTAGIEVADIAKRLIDYGFHAPTVSFPVAGTLMIEPTESESKAELDRFADAMIEIKNEIEEIANGTADKEDNVLKNAPHTATRLMDDNWNSYSREKAAYPLSYIREAKFWPSVARVDNAHGDRNLICSCPSIEEYETSLA